ncbi:MAG: hypothetical protein EA412_06435 [Chitinophagaceae bacterium]|nr:MAG: hypothetical protein EA412_06435 [Chitinophagaceae bacterium]
MVGSASNTISGESPRKGGFVVHPKKFALWVSFASLSMMFAGLTSAYIVRKGMGNWTEFPLPSAFTYSTIVIILSSLTMYWAFRAFRSEQLYQYRIALLSTFFLGSLFAYFQLMGWGAMQNMGIMLQGNPSGSFIYVISLAHLAHLAGGMIFLLAAIFRSFFVFKNPANMLIYIVDENKKVRIELLASYWHYVDFLWLYLFIFFLLNHL